MKLANGQKKIKSRELAQVNFTPHVTICLESLSTDSPGSLAPGLFLVISAVVPSNSYILASVAAVKVKFAAASFTDVLLSILISDEINKRQIMFQLGGVGFGCISDRGKLTIFSNLFKVWSSPSTESAVRASESRCPLSPILVFVVSDLLLFRSSAIGALDRAGTEGGRS